MLNEFYNLDEDCAKRVQKLFATIAWRYDLLNDLLSAGWHRQWKQRLVQLAGQPSTVLDLCCGTGDVALRFGANSRVVGVDFTEEMLRVAAHRAECLVTWIRADALDLPFPDNAFEVVSVGFGLRNLADLPAGLREIHRVLRPGGRLLSLDFGKPSWNCWRWCYFAHLRFWVPALGWMLAGHRDAYAYILSSLKQYPGQYGTKELMENLGYRDCGIEEFCGGAMAINFGVKPV